MFKAVTHFSALKELIFDKHYYLGQIELDKSQLFSDIVIALFCLAIALLFGYGFYRWRNRSFLRIFLLFEMLTVLSGLTHSVEAITRWHKVDILLQSFEAAVVIVSFFTIAEAISAVPKALTLLNSLNSNSVNLNSSVNSNSVDLNSVRAEDAASQAIEQQVIDRQQAERSLRQQAAQLRQALEFESMLKRVTDKVRDSLDEHYILDTAVHELGEELGVRSCSAALYDLASGTSTVWYEYTSSMFSTRGSIINLSSFPEIYEQLLQGIYFQFCILQPDPVRGRMSILACPVMDDQGVLGDLWLTNDRDYGFRDLDLRLVQQVANQCAIAIRQSRLYQASQRQVEELERLNHLKDDFLSTVSHELRTPMSNIKLATQMLEIYLTQAGLLDPSQQSPHKVDRYFNILQEESNREIALINDLLDLSRLEAETEPPIMTTIAAWYWLDAVVNSFQERAHSQQQQLIVKLDPNLPPLTTDLIRLEKILMELLSNACKYTPAGETIAVSAQVVTSTDATQQLLLQPMGSFATTTKVADSPLISIPAVSSLSTRSNASGETITLSQSSVADLSSKVECCRSDQSETLDELNSSDISDAAERLNQLNPSDISDQSDTSKPSNTLPELTQSPLQPTQSRRVKLSVSNSGTEIPLEERDRIFEKFYRIPNHDPWKHGGTGLGLALVKRRVESLGAKIWVESSNQTTTFVVEIPILM